MSKNEFYEFHNLNDCHLAQLTGVARQTIESYWKNGCSKKEPKLKLEIAIQIIEDYKLIWPARTTCVDIVGDYDMLDRFFKRAFDRLVAIEL
jgi:DNA-binding XRE family transcriptional regulator